MRIGDWSSDVCSADLATLRFDWPSGFGTPHDVHLTGRVAGWREDAGWRIATPALRIDGTGYGADVRGGLTFEGDGTRPRLDIASRLDDTQVDRKIVLYVIGVSVHVDIGGRRLL